MMRAVQVLSMTGVLSSGSAFLIPSPFIISSSSSSSSRQILPQIITCHARDRTRRFYRDDDHNDDTSFDTIMMGEERGKPSPTTTPAAAAAAAAAATTTNAEDQTTKSPSDFRSRMKAILVQQRKESALSPRRTNNVKSVISLEDFASVIEDGRREGKVVVVRFHATWCKKCLTLRPSFDKLAVSHPHITFIDVLILETNTNLHQGLGVKTVPFGHIYHPTNGFVVETKLSRQTLGEFVDLMTLHSSSVGRISS